MTGCVCEPQGDVERLSSFKHQVLYGDLLRELHEDDGLHIHDTHVAAFQLAQLSAQYLDHCIDTVAARSEEYSDQFRVLAATRRQLRQSRAQLVRRARRACVSTFRHSDLDHPCVWRHAEAAARPPQEREGRARTAAFNVQEHRGRDECSSARQPEFSARESSSRCHHPVFDPCFLSLRSPRHGVPTVVSSCVTEACLPHDVGGARARAQTGEGTLQGTADRRREEAPRAACSRPASARAPAPATLESAGAGATASSAHDPELRSARARRPQTAADHEGTRSC